MVGKWHLGMDFAKTDGFYIMFGFLSVLSIVLPPAPSLRVSSVCIVREVQITALSAPSYYLDDVRISRHIEFEGIAVGDVVVVGFTGGIDADASEVAVKLKLLPFSVQPSSLMNSALLQAFSTSQTYASSFSAMRWADMMWGAMMPIPARSII